MARFKASRFLRSPKVAKVVDPKADASDDSDQKAAPATEAPSAARVVEPMKARPVVQPQESHIDTSRRVDPGETMRRVDPSVAAKVAPHEPPSVQRVASAADLKQPESDSSVSRRGSGLVDEKADSSVTSVDDERGSAEKMDPESLGEADGGAAGGLMGKSVDDYTADDFGSRASAEGFGQFDPSAEEDSPAGSDRIPTGTLADSVESSLSEDEVTLVDPADMTNDGPEMPAGFEQSPGSMKDANLRGIASDADEYGSNSMADVGGLSGGAAHGTVARGGTDQYAKPMKTGDDSNSGTVSQGAALDTGPDTSGYTDDSSDDDTADDTGTPLTDDDKAYLDAAGATDALADEGLDVNNMTKEQVQGALEDMGNEAMVVEPGRAYLDGTGRGYDTEKMSPQEVADALGKEAEYELQGGDVGNAAPPSPSYVDADTGGAVDAMAGAQVAADAAKLHIPSTPIRGNIDPTEFGNGSGEATDTSILDMSDPVNVDDSTSFGGGSIGTPPPTAGVDFGPDHVDENPGGGLSDDIGGIGVGHDDGTLNIDLGTETGGMDPDAGGLMDDLSNIDDPSHMADTPDLGFAVDPGEALADSTIDPAADFHHVDRVDDIFE